MKTILTRALAAIVGALALAGVLLGVGHAQAPSIRAAVLSQGPRVFSFMGALPSGVTLTRASAGWAFNSTPELTSYATDVARFPYATDGSGLQGLLNEAAATNSIRNASMVGAVAGSPGTLPTNWAGIGAALNSGLTRTVVGTGTEDGIPYIDVKISGTPDASTTTGYAFDLATQIAALTGQVWTNSVYIRLTDGGLSNVTMAMRLNGRNSGGSVTESFDTALSPTGAALKTQRYNGTNTFANASTVYAQSGFIFTYTNGAPVNFTVRIGLPQLVQASAASSPIVTTTTAVTRAADVLALALPSRTYRSIRITRVSGVTTLPSVTVTGNSYTVPTDPSPLQYVQVTP